jgi:hypothetical protein
MKASARVSVLLVLMAVATFAGFTRASAEAMPECCDNNPPQCPAYTVCFDSGWCDGPNQCVIHGPGVCAWEPLCGG